MSKTEITTGISSNVPAYVTEENTNLGNENVSSNDVSIPEIKLLQAMSGELKKTSAKYIPDAVPGKLAVGKQLLDEVYVINLYYKKEYPIFSDSYELLANFETQKEADDYMDVQGLDPTRNNVVETANHACLHVDENGKVLGPAIMRMSSTKLRVSNDWNSAITGTNAPRFASIWKLSPVEQSNAKGSWYNYQIDLIGYADEETFKFAQDQYESIATPASKAA